MTFFLSIIVPIAVTIPVKREEGVYAVQTLQGRGGHLSYPKKE